MKEKYLVTVSLDTAIVVEANDEEEARDVAAETSTEEILEVFSNALENTGFEIETIEVYDE